MNLGASSPVFATFPLGQQWPTIDPFLFVAHHDDHYPQGDGSHGPKASLAGRNLGNDFGGLDGWSMYHGSQVPGFPSHPHRGFETITYVRQGFVDHSDSLGATARFGPGDTQWMTAGAGIVHAEMFPLLNVDGPNPLEMFQIWLNLPSSDKLVPAHFTMLWSHDTPRSVTTDGSGRRVDVTVIAGAIGEVRAPSTPPNSWAAQPDSDVAIWHIVLDPGAEWVLPAAGDDRSERVLYAFSGSGVTVAGHPIPSGSGAHIDASNDYELVAGPDGAEAMILQGRPIAEPIARYGPFVMNDDAEIRQAFADYQRTGFGGWPWPADDPVHDHRIGTDTSLRFARHADGRVDEP